MKKGLFFLITVITVLYISGITGLRCVQDHSVEPDPEPDYWTRKYGGVDTDWGRSVQQTPDSGFIIAGETYSIASSYDVYLIRTDPKGMKLWSKRFGGRENDNAQSVQVTHDSGFIIAGATWKSSFDVYLIRTDSNGDTLWTKTFGGPGADGGFSVQQTGDGGFVIAGYTESFGTAKRDVFLIRTNPNGDTLWTKTYGKDSLDWAGSVQQTSDGGFIIAGCTDSCGTYTKDIFGKDMFNVNCREPNSRDVYLIRTDQNGDTVWTKRYGGTRHDGAFSVQQTGDGGFIVVGETWSFGEGMADAYCIRTDPNGDTLWTKTYGGSGLDKGYSIATANGDGFIITGETTDFGAGYSDVYLIRINSSGGIVWTRTIGEAEFDKGSSVQQTFDGGYVISGASSSNSGGYDVYLIKLGIQ